MQKKTMARITFETIPLLAGGVLAYFLWKHNVLLTLIFLAMIASVFKLKYHHGDLFILIFGSILGFVLEVLSIVTKFHTFSNPDILGIPIWIALFWGYIFLLVKRISVIISEDAPSET